MNRFILILFAFSLTVYGQDSTIASSGKVRRFALEVVASPDLCFRTLVNVDGSPTSTTVYNLDNDNDRPKLGFTTGFCFRYTFCKRFEIESGLLYSNKGFRTKETDLIFGDLIDRRRGFVYNTTGLPSHGKIVYSFHYLDLPLKVNYLAGNKKLRFVCGAGLALNVLLKQTTSFKGTDPSGNHVTSSSSNDYYNAINLSPIVSAGINWQLSPRMDLRIEPSFRYGVIKIVDAPVSAYLWNTGLNLSYSIKL